jgi:Bacterial PH domain
MGSVPSGRSKRAGVTGGPQTFRSPTAVVIWWVWLLFAAANLIDLAVQGRDHESLVAAAILVLVTGVAYVTAQRPRIIADQAGITVVNPLRDHHIGWVGVTKVDLADLLRVHCQRGQDNIKIIYAWAVHYSRRRKLAAQAKARRQTERMSSGRPSGAFGLGLGNYGGGGRLAGYGTSPAEPASSAEADAERIAGVLREYATAARAEAVWADGTGPAAGTESAGTESAGARSAGTRPTAGAETAGAETARTESARTGSAGTEDAPAAGRPAATADAPATVAEREARDPRLAGWLEPLHSTWSARAVLALVIPALILLVVSLV